MEIFSILLTGLNRKCRTFFLILMSVVKSCPERVCQHSFFQVYDCHFILDSTECYQFVQCTTNENKASQKKEWQAQSQSMTFFTNMILN